MKFFLVFRFLVLLVVALAGAASVAHARGSRSVGTTTTTTATTRSSCKSLEEVRTITRRSPGVKSRPGDVKNKNYFVEVPEGHFATRDFVAELVYEDGTSVPLSDVYLHHWVLMEIAVPKEEEELDLHAVAQENPYRVMHTNDHVFGVREGLLAGGDAGSSKKPPQRRFLQFWAKGGETRRLKSTLPAPYGIEGGYIPEGMKTYWILNVHSIDTRGALHRMASTECRCDLFTPSEKTPQKPLEPGYYGGLYCCEDESRCTLKEGFDGDDPSLERTIYLQYTWSYVAWDECVVPLLSFGADVSQVGNVSKVEYNVEGSCKLEDIALEECIDTRETTVVAPFSGDVIHATAHLHSAALDSTLYGEDGHVICNSAPIYGHGNEAGNEKGYVVGIVACYPALESSSGGKIKEGEKLRWEVKYTRVNGPHTGVMGFLFAKVAPEGVIETPIFHNRKMIN